MIFFSIPLVVESKQDLVSYPQPQKTPIPAPSEKAPNQPSKSTEKEPEPKKREEGQEPRLGHQKREAERYLPPRREGLSFRRDREKEPWSGETRQDGESKSKWLAGAWERRRLVLWLGTAESHTLAQLFSAGLSALVEGILLPLFLFLLLQIASCCSKATRLNFRFLSIGEQKYEAGV